MAGPSLFAQQGCNTVFDQKVSMSDRQKIRSKSIIVHSQTSLSYQFVLQVDDDGIILEVTSTDEHPLEKGNTKIMLISTSGEKRLYDFISTAEQIKVGNRKGYQNSIQLNMENLKWLAVNKVRTLRLVDMTVSKMYVRPVSSTRQEELKNTAYCLTQVINQDLLPYKEVNVTIAGAKKSGPVASSRGGRSPRRTPRKTTLRH